ncbi:MAG: hypothetical protein FE78DRAFT_88943, partial [Acidomyces sp. 'richmondensis']
MGPWLPSVCLSVCLPACLPINPSVLCAGLLSCLPACSVCTCVSLYTYVSTLVSPPSSRVML